jgi:hypothetical protein
VLFWEDLVALKKAGVVWPRKRPWLFGLEKGRGCLALKKVGVVYKLRYWLILSGVELLGGISEIIDGGPEGGSEEGPAAVAGGQFFCGLRMVVY